MVNPFHYGEIVTGDNFADREKELKSIVSDLQSSSRIFLLSPRRYGKSSLLANVALALKKKGCLVAYIDLYKASSLRTFIELYTSQVTSVSRSKLAEVAGYLKEIIPNLRPKITIDSPEGVDISFDVSFDAADVRKQIYEIYELPQLIAKRKKKKFIVIFDEFQEITGIGGMAIEKAMRAVFQTHTDVNYLFAGSKQDMLLDMVRNKSRAFFQMGKIITLKKIPRYVFVPFLLKNFLGTKYRVSPDVVEHIVDVADDFPHNVQFLCHELWEMRREEKKIVQADVEIVLHKILENNAPFYVGLWDTLGLLQRRVLIAIAHEGSNGLFSQEIIKSYDLQTPSSAQTALQGLQKKGIVDKENGTYFISDIFYKHWIIKNIYT